MNTHTSTLRSLSVAAGLALAASGCGRDSSSEDFRLAGAGLNPDEIGPSPRPHGGLIEYNWVNFAGAGLPLSVLGLVSFTEAGPGLADFAPPYSAVTGTAYVFESDEPSPETLFGSWSPPPNVEGTCYTNYDPRSFISSLVDVGNEVRIRAADSDTFFRMGRRPALYGPNAESAFPIYFGFETWRNEPLYYRTFDDDAELLTDAEEATAFGRNFPHGEMVEINFPGSIPPQEASFGSIPMPLAAHGQNRVWQLPGRSDALVLGWRGPLYNSIGEIADSAAEDRKTCLTYHGTNANNPLPADCLEQPSLGAAVPDGQVYTGPWDAEGGKITLTYSGSPLTYTADGITEGSAAVSNEVISVSVRFLGPLDVDDEYKHEYVAAVPPSDDIELQWGAAQNAGYIPESESVPFGRRPATSCDEDGEWLFDEDLVDQQSDPVLTLQGEPTHRLAEVTCLLPAVPARETGSFDLTMDMVQDAFDYAADHGAQGAVFYVNRATTLDLDAPAVRDAYGSRRDTSDIKVVSNAVSIGRFHYDAQ